MLLAPLVMKILEPLIFQPPSTFLATVLLPRESDPAPDSVPLSNRGREAHTYAHHVATRYNELAEVTVFTQGNPFDHVPDFLEQVDSY